MKQWRYLCAAALIVGSMAVEAGAADIDVPQNVIRDAAATYCEMQQNGTLYQHLVTAMEVDGNQVALLPLSPDTSKYCISFSGPSALLFGVIDVETGEIVLPVEYAKIGLLTDDKALVVKTTDGISECWFAAPDGSLTTAQLPLEGEVIGIVDRRVTLGVYHDDSYHDIYADVSSSIKIPRLTLLDENLAVIRDNIDGTYPPQAISFIEGTAPIRVGSKKWTGSVKYQDVHGDGKCGLIDRHGLAVGAQDFDKIDEADGHWIGERNINSWSSRTYLLDGKGGETLISRTGYSDWAKNEKDQAIKHDLFLWFDYPQLNITRLNFAKLTMKLYHKLQPDAQLPASAPHFSDESYPDVLSAAALGIITGYDDGTFRPYQSITRQEAATMLDRLYAVLGGKIGTATDNPYADDAQLSDWARGGVYDMRDIGIMQGKENNRFCPKDGYTEEQALVTMERMYQHMNK